MVGNLLVISVITISHGFIIWYLRKHRHACTTCPMRHDVLREMRELLK
jgi:hypothetical protein